MKKLACRLGRHAWTTRVDEGESYKDASGDQLALRDGPR
jgi:hypothetical protein